MQIQTLTSLCFSLAFTPLLFADTTAAYPPHSHEIAGGKRSPTFSAANAQAIYWINLIDQQQFSASWLEAGGLIKDLVAQNQWAAAMKKTRVGLGTVNSRKVLSHQITTTLPEGTRGYFIIIKYATNYSKKPGQIETIILMTEGTLELWKVISYRIGRQ